MDRAEKESALRQIREEKEAIRQKMLYYRRKIDHLTTRGTTYQDTEGQSQERLEYWNKIKELSDKDKELDIQRSRIRQGDIIKEPIFAQLQSKLGKGEGMESRTIQVEFAAPQKAIPKIFLSRKEREHTEKKAVKGKRVCGLEAFGVEKEGQSSLKKFFANPILLSNPVGLIGDPPNPIMRIQLLNLWKRSVGAEDLGDFTTFMKEVSDLTYHEAKDKLIKTYGKPGGREFERAAGAEERLHEGMCDYAQDQCVQGDREACKVACQECGITDACLPQEHTQKPRKAPETRPIEEIHRFLEERGIKPEKPVKTKPGGKAVIRRIPTNGIIELTEKDLRSGKIILRW